APPSVVGGKPYELIKRQEGTAGLDWAAVTRLLDPQPQHRTDRAPDQPFDVGPLAGWVAGLPEGNRNDGLFWAANRAVEAGLTDLGELAEAARLTGLDEREIARTLESARRNADRPLGAAPAPGRTPGPAIPQGEPEARGHGTSGRAVSPEPGRQPEAGRQPELAVREWNRSALDRPGIALAGEDKEAEPR